MTSGQTLLWRAVAAATAAVVIAELDWLFTLHGPPLVLKSDNGSAFIADEARSHLRRWSVFRLFSPPRRPQYNGAIEASIGSLKTRTAKHCDLAGHPEVWTAAALEAARLEANHGRPKRLRGLTPEQVWECRMALPVEERTAFAATVEQFRRAERAERDSPEGEV